MKTPIYQQHVKQRIYLFQHFFISNVFYCRSKWGKHKYFMKNNWGIVALGGTSGFPPILYLLGYGHTWRPASSVRVPDASCLVHRQHVNLWGRSLIAMIFHLLSNLVPGPDLGYHRFIIPYYPKHFCNLTVKKLCF